MILHPAVVAKAQREIDTVIGDARLPNFSDRASLPYIDCILSECLRWAAPVPLGITLALLLRNSLLFTFCIGLPHRLMEDDVYENMYIPKGSVVRFTSDCHSLGCADLRAQDHCEYMVKTTVCGISPFESTLLIFVCRTILRNSTLYPNPDVFDPDRFMTKVDQQTERRRDPRKYVFGFGRRYSSFI